MKVKIGFWDCVLKSWRSSALAIWKMPILFGSAALAALAVGFAGTNFTFRMHHVFASGSGPVYFFLLTSRIVLLTSIGALINAPIGVAVHRFILLDEINNRFFWKWRPEVRRFYAWVLFISLFMGLSPFLGSWLNSIAWIFGFLFNIGIIFFIFRIILIFPGTAINVTHIRVENYWRASRGHFWYFVGVSIFTTLPTTIVFGIFGMKVAFYNSYFAFPILTISGFMLTILLAALASWLYRKFYQSQSSAVM